MPKSRMRDMVVLLPGITGSVLAVGDDPVWSPSAGALWSTLVSLGARLNRLAVPAHDPTRDVDDPLDDVTAPGMIEHFHGVFGLAQIDGYTALRQDILDEFDVTRGDPRQPGSGNLYDFPYDWRLSSRFNGRRLGELVRPALQAWREGGGGPDAKVILIAHSMGGLVSRHWLEVGDDDGPGWPLCRALITFGTPYRGSLDAVGYVANGYKKAFLDLTAVVRSCPSVYELMPTYECLRRTAADGSGDTWTRVAETDGLPSEFDPGYLQAAAAFHDDIEAAVEAHRDDADYLRDGYRIFPVVGVQQPTHQHAALADGRITVGAVRPPTVDSLLEGGDGTVPRYSATPLELSRELREVFFAQRHSGLHVAPTALTDLVERLKQMQAIELGAIRGGEIEPERGKIGMAVESLFLPGEEVVATAEVTSANGPDGMELVAVCDKVTGEPASTQVPVRGGLVELGDLAEGRYKLTVLPRRVTGGAPRPVSDFFEVAGVA